ncbi:hypothetical protein [Desulfuromonas sp. AOP6]|uniref:tetratricopeptide repeat protein n=1 Tax=Desulfuromonas sp. AOP6 TaxID=1566351 RepID=UPI00126BD9AB|nr:hypothetical protein [Desulfuromonas sp. AOP6]BCA79102.1 hypothetical protein AOP6_0889 [Desulfuromonas sp. AOP6]
MFNRILIFSVVLVLFTGVVAQAAVEKNRIPLLEMSKTAAPGFTRISLLFPEIPEARVSTSGHRVDLLLPGAYIPPTFRSLPLDSEIVDVLFGERQQEAILSFLVRRAVRRVEITSDRQTRQLHLDIFWVTDNARARPAIAFGLPGGPVLDAGSASGRKGVSSPYTGRWPSFFSEYETPLSFPLTPGYSLPPFPLSALGEEKPLPAALTEIVEKGRERLWGAALTLLEGPGGSLVQETDPELFRLLRGELLLRSGRPVEAAALLELAMSGSADSLRRFLRVQAEAAAGEPYKAVHQVRDDDLGLSEQSPLRPYLELFRAELDLALGRLETASNRLAAATSKFRGPAEALLRLRQADLLFARGERATALKTYRELAQKGILDHHRSFSLSRYAQLLYEQKEYAEAAEQYLRLGLSLSGQSGEDLAYFAAARAQVRAGRGEPALLQLQNIVDTFAGQEGAWRSQLLLHDQQVAAAGDETSMARAARGYRQLADQIPYRELREEATFKYALTEYLSGRKLESVETLQVLLRDYAAGRLSREVSALMAEALPGVVRELVADAHYVDALVRVEQNRELLLAAQVGREFLLELGGVFMQLGFWDRAARLYLFLLDYDEVAPGVEVAYLPLVQCFHRLGDLARVERYVSQYGERHPRGKDAPELFYLRLKTLDDVGQRREAVDLLLAAGPTAHRETERLAARLFMSFENYVEVEKRLAPLMDRNLQDAHPEDIFLRAEALYRDDKPKPALPFFTHLAETLADADQARYRVAQIHLQTGNRSLGLKFLRELAEKGRSELWRKMAREALAMQREKS